MMAKLRRIMPQFGRMDRDTASLTWEVLMGLLSMNSGSFPMYHILFSQVIEFASVTRGLPMKVSTNPRSNQLSMPAPAREAILTIHPLLRLPLLLQILTMLLLLRLHLLLMLL